MILAGFRPSLPGRSAEEKSHDLLPKAGWGGSEHLPTGKAFSKEMVPNPQGVTKQPENTRCQKQHHRRNLDQRSCLDAHKTLNGRPERRGTERVKLQTGSSIPRSLLAACYLPILDSTDG